MPYLYQPVSAIWHTSIDTPDGRRSILEIARAIYCETGKTPDLKDLIDSFRSWNNTAMPRSKHNRAHVKNRHEYCQDV
ncbi:MAG: hypothetical protein KJ964_10660 [Verrucomicrobia bacterium]|nr:hypothetical protein [Verrucomicrobiota bacterium]MBU1733645.1 hypothetical protein [Verrucomicrobiota bacterium]MBU1856723.1 hypothetical protein [Verrucomicrobiota bacterium]